MADPVAERFSEAAHRYDSAAQIQRRAAGLFDAWLADQGLVTPGCIAEIGCGTGMLTRLLNERCRDATLHVTDLAPRMVELCRAALPPSPRLHYAVLDGRDAVFEPAPDWVVSAMCFQWFDPLLPVLRHHIAHAKVLAFSLVLDGSFSAWRKAHEAAGLSAGLQGFPDYDELRRMCESLDVSRVRAHRISLTESHANGLSFAKGLREIGASQPRSGHAPVNLRPVLRRLEQGLAVNYEIGFFCLER